MLQIIIMSVSKLIYQRVLNIIKSINYNLIVQTAVNEDLHNSKFQVEK